MEEQTITSEAETTVKNLIKYYSRATWSNKKGQFVIRPSWDVICDRIIALAAETLMNQREKGCRGTDDLIPLCESNPLYETTILYMKQNTYENEDELERSIPRPKYT
ncbi:hypothetical protein CHS0354_019570 [Potamilus streckersoni]|uniref:Uncharacterized protein n=1 Tax=Potamilus streckersoni TaxID=2493646 RepID=A0AAE0TGJ1_9BIVA|nr:hypothetical protein CHS0354_019570 [Potamilus streckersoni]